MRFLMSFAGGFGHASPLFPIARALADNGHDVAFTGQPSVLDTVAAAGFPVFDSGGTVPAMQPASHMLFQPFDAGKLRDRVRESFGGYIARERLVGVADVARDWKPDALVCDEMDFGAMLAMERAGLPHVAVSVMASGRLTTAEWFADPLDRIRAEHGLPPDPDLGMIGRHLVFSPFPDVLRDPAVRPHPQTCHFRNDASNRAEHTGTRVRPRIYATFGTEFNVLATDLFHVVLRGLAELDVDVVATIGSSLDPGAFGPQPDNVEIATFVDQTILLPSCDLMVSHGGSGSLLGGLTHGLPMLLLPMGADQPFNAERGQALGFAQSIDPRTATSDTVRIAAEALLQSERSKDAAIELRRAIEAQPSVAFAAASIEELVMSVRSSVC